jgi:hypothetical protein
MCRRQNYSAIIRNACMPQRWSGLSGEEQAVLKREQSGCLDRVTGLGCPLEYMFDTSMPSGSSGRPTRVLCALNNVQRALTVLAPMRLLSCSLTLFLSRSPSSSSSFSLSSCQCNHFPTVTLRRWVRWLLNPIPLLAFYDSNLMITCKILFSKKTLISTF